MCCDITIAVFLSRGWFFILNTAFQTEECKCIGNTQPRDFNLAPPLTNHFPLGLYLLMPGWRVNSYTSIAPQPHVSEPSCKVNCHFFLHYSKLAFASSKPTWASASRMIYIKVGIKGKSVTWKKGVFATNLVCACQEVFIASFKKKPGQLPEIYTCIWPVFPYGCFLFEVGLWS